MNPFRHLARLRGHSVWTQTLGPGSLIVDAGAHRGEFSQFLRERFGCRCLLVEANPDLAAKLNAGERDRIVAAALSDRDGEARFSFSDNPEAGSIAASGKDLDDRTSTVKTISLESLLALGETHRLNLLKLDIEGAEFDLIPNTPDEVLRRIDQITIEFHDFLPSFADRGLFESCRQRLESLGFSTFIMTIRGHGDVLFLNREKIVLSSWMEALLRLAGRWVIKSRELFSNP